MFEEQCKRLEKIYRDLDDISEDLCEIKDEIDEIDSDVIKSSEDFIRFLNNEGLLNPKLKESINFYLKYKNN